MFCRSCHYDLRGQEIGRCSECGSGFDPADPATFLVALPTWHELLSRGGQALGVISRKTSCVLITIICTAGWCLLPQLTHCGSGPYFKMSYDNLDHVITTWRAEVAAGQFPVGLTPDRDTHHFERRISPFQHRSYISERREWVTWIHERICWSGFLILINSLLLAMLARGVVRRFAYFVAPLAVATFILGALAEPLAERYWRGDHAYLSDYIYVPASQWTGTAENDAHPVAWPANPMAGRSWCAYSDGTVRLLDESHATALAAGVKPDQSGTNLEPTPKTHTSVHGD